MTGVGGCTLRSTWSLPGSAVLAVLALVGFSVFAAPPSDDVGIDSKVLFVSMGVIGLAAGIRIHLAEENPRQHPQNPQRQCNSVPAA